MAPVETGGRGPSRRLRELVARQILDIAIVDDEVGEPAVRIADRAGMAWIVNAALIAGGLFLILWPRRRSGILAKAAPAALTA